MKNKQAMHMNTKYQFSINLCKMNLTTITKDPNDLMNIVIIINQYLTLPILIVGLFCNVLCWIMCNGFRSKHSSLKIFIRILSVTDSITLLTGLITRFVSGLTKFHQNFEVIFDNCRSIKFLFAFTSDMSAWTIVSMVTERAIALQCPLLYSKYCSRRRSLFTTIGISFVLLGINVHLMAFMESIKDRYGYPICYPKRQFEYFLQHIYTWLDLLFYSIFPQTLVWINAIIIAR